MGAFAAEGLFENLPQKGYLANYSFNPGGVFSSSLPNGEVVM